MAKPAIFPSAYTAFPHVPHSRSVLEFECRRAFRRRSFELIFGGWLGIRLI